MSKNDVYNDQIGNDDVKDDKDEGQGDSIPSKAKTAT